MAAGGIVDGHVQLKILPVDAQLGQLVRGDQQMQRWLLITEVVANHLWQVSVAMLPQGKLQGPLQISRVIQGHGLYATQATKQTLIDQHMVAAWVAVAELFQVSANQPVVTWIAPVMKGAL